MFRLSRLLGLLCLPLAAQAAEIPAKILGNLHRNQPSVVLVYAQQELVRHPQDPDLLGLMGAALVDQGDYEAALPLLEQSEGSGFYERFGIRYHADALRAVGGGVSAAALRAEQQLVAPADRDVSFYAAVYRVDDLRSVGDLAGAQALAEEAQLTYPERPIFAAQLADIAMDAGDLDAAAVYLREAGDGNDNPRQLRVEARYLLALGCPDAALDILLGERRRNASTTEFWMLLAEARIQQGSLGDAETILDLRRFNQFDTPIQRVTRAHLLRAKGDLAGARVVIEEGLARLPTNPELLAAAAELGLP